MSALPIGRGVRPGERFRLDDVSAAWVDRRRGIIRSYRETGSLAVTAERYQITRQRVSQIVRKYGPRHPLTGPVTRQSA